MWDFVSERTLTCLLKVVGAMAAFSASKGKMPGEGQAVADRVGTEQMGTRDYQDGGCPAAMDMAWDCCGGGSRV